MSEVTVAVSVLELAFGVVPAVVAAALWRYRTRPAALPVIVMSLAAAVYSASSGAGTLLGIEPVAEFLFHLRWPLGATIAAGAFYTAVEYTDRTEFQHPLIVIGLIVFLTVDAVVVFTNPIHQQFFSALVFQSRAAGPVYQVEPLFFAHLLGSVGLAIGGIGFLVVRYLRDQLYRRQTGALIIGIGLGVIFFIVESAMTVHPAFNIATAGLAAGSLALLWAIVRVEFLQTVPIARETLMESMDDIVIALDPENRVIDMNRTAATLAGSAGVGDHVDTVFDAHPEFAERLVATSRPTDTGGEPDGSARTEGDVSGLSLFRDGELRHYDLRVSAIEHETGHRAGPAESTEIGRLIVVRDVTPTRRREEELNLVKQVFARVLRHNLRNDLNIIKGEADQLDLDGGGSDSVDAIIDRADHMIDLSEKARHLERIIERPDSSLQFTLRSVVETAVEDVTGEYPDATVRIEMDDLPPVQAHGAFPVAVENIVENACEHHPQESPTIGIRATAEGTEIRLTIEDDGPGIPQQEIEVLDAVQETKLEHGSGIGLWLVSWIVQRSNGTVEIQSTDFGTRVELLLLIA